MKRNLLLLIVLVLSFVCLFTACNKAHTDPATDPVNKVETLNRPIEHELEFGGVYIDLTIDQFNALGFSYGDSVDVSFSNGEKIFGIPYYNGYYTQNGQALVVAYPGYPFVKVCINNGNDLYVAYNLSENDTCSITLKQKAAFKDIQDARDIHYEDDRSKFTTDAEFANFRNISVGNLLENKFYRSASPCDNQHNRAPYVDTLIHGVGVQFILNLADNDAKIQGYIAKDDFNSPYFKSLYETGKVTPIALNMNYGDDVQPTLLMGTKLGDTAFKNKVIGGFRSLMQSDGPYLIHCTEGKDRTGFICMLIEALAGATYQEIVDDYMITYDNYYKITKTKDPTKYNTIVNELLNPMIESVVGNSSVDYKTVSLVPYAKAWLTNGGMTQTELDTLMTKLVGAGA